MLWDDGAELESIPRRVPWRVKIRLCAGGPGTAVAWFVAAFGICVSALMFSPKAVWGEIQLSTSAATVTLMGTATGWSETSTSVNDAPVVANHYEFSLNDQIYENVAYFTDKGLDTGTPVKIKVLVSDPTVSVIEGARSSEISAMFLLLLLSFPLISLLVVIRILLKARRRIGLMTNGIETQGIVIETINTNVSVNEEVVFKVIIEYTGVDGKLRRVTTRTTDLEELLDEPEETLLVHPTKPSVAIPIDILPDYVHLTRDKGFSGGGILGGLAAMGSLILPFGTVAFIAAFFRGML
jgi:hypothetical protein